MVFVQTTGQYALCRFIAGLGLAGELGAGITLVSELLSKEKRGIGTSVVAGLGLTGAVIAYFISMSFNWRICYFIGGGMGLLLLMFRVSVFESGMFKNIQHAKVSRGNFLMFFNHPARFRKYILSILIGVPTWYVIGILVSFSTEFAKEFGIRESIQAGRAVMFAYAAISVGDILIGFVSQYFKSRKKALYIFYGITIIGMILYFNQYNGTASNMYLYSAILGFGTGFWAIFVTMAAEQFGTNLRATAATTVPNMVRGSLPIITLLMQTFKTSYGFIHAALITGVIVMVVAIVATFLSEETYHKDLDYIEMI
jgi:MFS family permease